MEIGPVRGSSDGEKHPKTDRSRWCLRRLSKEIAHAPGPLILMNPVFILKITVFLLSNTVKCFTYII